jgi:hypothetical protein
MLLGSDFKAMFNELELGLGLERFISNIADLSKSE